MDILLAIIVCCSIPWAALWVYSIVASPLHGIFNKNFDECYYKDKWQHDSIPYYAMIITGLFCALDLVLNIQLFSTALNYCAVIFSYCYGYVLIKYNYRTILSKFH